MATNVAVSMGDLLDKAQCSQVFNVVSALAAVFAPDKDPTGVVRKGHKEAHIAREAANMLFGLACFAIRVPVQLMHFLHSAAVNKNLLFRFKHNQGQWTFTFLIKGKEQTKVTLERTAYNVELQRKTRYVRHQFVEFFKTETRLTSSTLAVFWPGIAAEYQPAYGEHTIPPPTQRVSFLLAPSQEGIASTSRILGNAWSSSAARNKVAITESYLFSTTNASVRKQLLSSSLNIYDNSEHDALSNVSGKNMVSLYKDRQHRLEAIQASAFTSGEEHASMELYSSSLALRNPFYRFSFNVIPSAYDFPAIHDRTSSLGFESPVIQVSDTHMRCFDTFTNLKLYLSSLYETMTRGSDTDTPQPYGSLASTRNHSGAETLYEYGKRHRSNQHLDNQAGIEPVVPAGIRTGDTLMNGEAMEAAALRASMGQLVQTNTTTKQKKKVYDDQEETRKKDRDLHTSELIGVNLPHRRPKSSEAKHARSGSKKRQKEPIHLADANDEACQTPVKNSEFKLSKPDTVTRTQDMHAMQEVHTAHDIHKHGHTGQRASSHKATPVSTQSVQNRDRFLSFMSATAQCVADIGNAQKRNTLMRAISKGIQSLLAENEVDTFELFGFCSTPMNTNVCTLNDI